MIFLTVAELTGPAIWLATALDPTGIPVAMCCRTMARSKSPFLLPRSTAPNI
jgi:hypothetical protein